MITCGTASASPDVVVTSVNAPGNVSPGSTVTINDTVSTGDQAADGLHVGYYIQDEYAVVKKPATQHNASIYENSVVWSDYRYNRTDCDIYVKDVTTGIDKYIYPTLGNQSNPAIYGNVIVWQDDTSGHWQILGYKVPNRSDPIAPDIYILYPTSTADQINPSIYQDKIVWQQYNTTTGNWDIYLYDFLISGDAAMPEGKETTQITTNGANHINPYVNGNYIVWQDNRNGNWDIYAYDLSTGAEIPICTSTGDQTNPSVYGDNFVWQDNRNGNWDIYMCDLSKDPANPIRITNNTFDQTKPAIYGDKIVWQDNRNGNWDIYMYDLTLRFERQLTTNTGNQIDPAIYDNKVVWTDDRNGNEDIYITDKFTLASEYTRYISSLAPTTSDSASSSITLPSDLKANVNYYLIVMAEDKDGNIVSTKMSSTPMIVPDVDLTVPSISGPAAAQPGKSIAIVNTVQNTGSQNSKPFRIKFYLSKDSTITTSDAYLGYKDISGINANSISIPYYTPVTIPSNLIGSYYIGAIVDSGNGQCETNELNNIVVSSNTINIGAPDLVITSITTGSTSYKKGSTITIPNTVKNQGNVGANGFNVYFYLSKDSSITTSDILIGQRYISSLTAGATNSATNSFTLPSNISGSYYVGAIADSTSIVAETNELNNIKVSSNTISISVPDLAATSISTGSISYKRGSTIAIKNTVKNQGSATSGGFYVKFYLSTNSKYTTSSDVYLGKRYVSSLGVGSSNRATTYLRIPSTMKKGHYSCKMVIYPVNRTADSKTSDKVRCSQIWLNIY